jgi:hypothetical protein
MRQRIAHRYPLRRIEREQFANKVEEELVDSVSGRDDLL